MLCGGAGGHLPKEWVTLEVRMSHVDEWEVIDLALFKDALKYAT